MKTQLPLVIALFGSLNLISQTNGWYQFMGVTSISTVQVVDTSPESVLVGTNIGLIKYNTSTQQVTDYLNLTSQNPAVGNIRGISQNPTNNDIALETGDGFAIYNGTNVIHYNYDNSDLTVGEGSSQPLKTYYGVGGELYLYKTDIKAYQILDNGVFELEVATNFRPTSIMENGLGTKVYFGGWNNGLWELEKSTSSYTNYTTSNSGLLLNTINNLYRDSNDLLYISTGGYVGFNTLDSSGTWNTYQELMPSSTFHYPVFDFDVSQTTGKVLVNTFTANLGFFEVNLPTNTWTQYTNDNTNCVNLNSVVDAIYGLNDNIYTAKNSSIPILKEFIPSTNTCLDLDLNYLNAPDINLQYVKSLALREKSNGNLEIGYTDYFHLNSFEINPYTFNGILNNFTQLDPPSGELYTDVYADNDKFIIDKKNGLSFVDNANTVTPFNYNVSGFSSIKTKKATLKNSDNGLLNFVAYGFLNGEYHIYRTQCNTSTGTCEDLDEILITNRNVTKPISFGVYENPEDKVVTCTSIQTNNNTGSDILVQTSEHWNGNSANTEYGHAAHFLIALLNIDPVVTGMYVDFSVRKSAEINQKSETELEVLTPTDNQNDLPIVSSETFDTNMDGINDKILSFFNAAIFDGNNNFIQSFVLLGSSNNASASNTVNDIVIKAINFATDSQNWNTTATLEDLPNASISNVPKDFTVIDAIIKKYTSTEAVIILLTNYGILIKTAIDISNLLLNTNEKDAVARDIHLYPNPSRDMVSFSDNSIKEIEVYDLNGRKIMSNTGNSIAVKSLAKGIYIVKGINGEYLTVSKKLIKN